MDTVGEGGETTWTSRTDLYTAPRLSQPVGSCCVAQGTQPALLRDDLEGWDVEDGRDTFKRGMYVYIYLVHSYYTAATNTILQCNYSPI